MNILLDTHVLLWWLKDTRRLGPAARQLIRVPGTSVWVSAASMVTSDPRIRDYDIRTIDAAR